MFVFLICLIGIKSGLQAGFFLCDQILLSDLNQYLNCATTLSSSIQNTMDTKLY